MMAMTVVVKAVTATTAVLPELPVCTVDVVVCATVIPVGVVMLAAPEIGEVAAAEAMLLARLGSVTAF